MDTLKQGGVAIHTTEFNLSSNGHTLESRDLSLYRRRDIQELAERLMRAGYNVEPIDFDPGEALIDDYVDLPPYREEPHLRLRIGEYDCTSIGLIISRVPPRKREFVIPLGSAIQHNSARIQLRKEAWLVRRRSNLELRGKLRLAPGIQGTGSRRRGGVRLDVRDHRHGRCDRSRGERSGGRKIRHPRNFTQCFASPSSGRALFAQERWRRAIDREKCP